MEKGGSQLISYCTRPCYTGRQTKVDGSFVNGHRSLGWNPDVCVGVANELKMASGLLALLLRDYLPSIATGSTAVDPDNLTWEILKNYCACTELVRFF